MKGLKKPIAEHGAHWRGFRLRPVISVTLIVVLRHSAMGRFDEKLAQFVRRGLLARRRPQRSRARSRKKKLGPRM